MAEISRVLTHQILIMFVYVFLGAFLYRKKIISDIGSKEIASVLVKCVIPAVMIKSFCTVPDQTNIRIFKESLFAAAVSLTISIAISRILYKNEPVNHFAASFSNAGFIGIPLVSAAFGEKSVFSIIMLIVVLNILQITYGVNILSEKRGIHLKEFANPIVISGLIGILLFFSGAGTKLPDIILTPLKAVADMNAPLAMIVLGTYFAKTDFRKVLSDKRIYILCAIRLLLIPLATAVIFSLLSLNSESLLAVLVAASAPVGANVAIYSQINGKDYAYASSTVVLSTLLSLFTIPVVVLIAEKIL